MWRCAPQVGGGNEAAPCYGRNSRPQCHGGLQRRAKLCNWSGLVSAWSGCEVEESVVELTRPEARHRSAQFVFSGARGHRLHRCG